MPATMPPLDRTPGAAPAPALVGPATNLTRRSADPVPTLDRVPPVAATPATEGRTLVGDLAAPAGSNNNLAFHGPSDIIRGPAWSRPGPSISEHHGRCPRPTPSLSAVASHDGPAQHRPIWPGRVIFILNLGPDGSPLCPVFRWHQHAAAAQRKRLVHGHRNILPHVQHPW